MFGTFSFKIDFSKPIAGFGLFGVYQSRIALCEIRFRTVTEVRTVVRPNSRPLRKGRRVEEVECYSFWRLYWGFREHDSKLMICCFIYTYVFLYIAFALVRLSHSVCRLLFLNGLPEARLEKRAIRLIGYGICHDGSTPPDF